jgi:hypothetical protein
MLSKRSGSKQYISSAGRVMTMDSRLSETPNPSGTRHFRKATLGVQLISGKTQDCQMSRYASANLIGGTFVRDGLKQKRRTAADRSLTQAALRNISELSE